jgi:uracil-DNA glycosylase
MAAVTARKRHARQRKGGLAAGLPDDWRRVLHEEFDKPYFHKLEEFVASERRTHTVYPPEQDVFNAFKYTPYAKVKSLLLGQDPYHDEGQAHGLCFSVRPGALPPPSLINILKELHKDLSCEIPDHGCVIPWAEHGVMLLNAVLTVRAHQPASHKYKGWEVFSDAVIRALNDRPKPVVFLLWGGFAQKKVKLIDTGNHRVVTAAHPSPLSAGKFLGSHTFLRANHSLEELHEKPIDWCLPNREELVPDT